MTTEQLPAFVLGWTICTYWFCVAVKVVRVRRDAREVKRVLIPAHRLEQYMWVVWIPLLAGWMLTPFLSYLGFWERWAALRPVAVAVSPAFLVLRFAAAGIGLVCLALSIVCWHYMGRHWRMSIDPTQEGALFVDGPFAYVRHPIYSLSILLMLCSVVIVPCPLMFVLAATHVGLMQIKARHEEQFLRNKYGRAYDDYCSRTGRFIPMVSGRRVARSSGP